MEGGPWTPVASFILFCSIAPATRHRATIRHEIPLPATQGFPAEVAAGSRPCLVNGTAPSPDSAAIQVFFPQVPARGISKEITVRFLQPPLAEVMHLVGFALPDENYREPAAAFATAEAGTGGRRGRRKFHTTRFDRNECKDNGSPDRFPGSREWTAQLWFTGKEIAGIPARCRAREGDVRPVGVPIRGYRYPSAGLQHTSGDQGPPPHPVQTPSAPKELRYFGWR